MQKYKEIESVVNWGYFIDEDGLYFQSLDKDGKIIEAFDINGIATTTLCNSDVDILHLCYIYSEDETQNDI